MPGGHRGGGAGHPERRLRQRRRRHRVDPRRRDRACSSTTSTRWSRSSASSSRTPDGSAAMGAAAHAMARTLTWSRAPRASSRCSVDRSAVTSVAVDQDLLAGGVGLGRLGLGVDQTDHGASREERTDGARKHDAGERCQQPTNAALSPCCSLCLPLTKLPALGYIDLRLRVSISTRPDPGDSRRRRHPRGQQERRQVRAPHRERAGTADQGRPAPRLRGPGTAATCSSVVHLVEAGQCRAGAASGSSG